MDIGMVGPALVLGLGCIGSSIGCGIAGMASHAVMSRVEENHGVFVGMSAAPASQSIYGLVLTLLMSTAIKSGSLSAWNGIGIALFVGLALLASSIYQGMCAATAIQASAKQPAVIGKSFAAIGIVEGISLFAFVIGLLLI
ncbi:MAG: V-type ATP synthase subunit K [Chlamydiae bacterium GWC2_50_10]|nr:MAG: V-type ATP synthase subunit K [Chlamydiae bacterium GWA2_50_15]OGN53774.1 MAG: V-type ATP synthase subunit K [Chlamydiae bacterium GWC2_50_10]OGN55093.1 MAG: V-type ATP synthase subunit K [Chlamydiae bacterium GWF2_49_8]OGN57759.1 MAG: V-type ATP synthase subunit K [Chlamydiae bacterium RIFCSPHIGHO2_02_FULL_49_29]OGN62618.1 MAG: V-type ATP synthase subunit K [Chlamydiae bacterium RIFCSPHIGHO2_12_FULL_49_32]OGN68234.1 MAG: V-type ATP synthase subunit K [Chlamydiae bacterium RIFCSPLOWO2_